MILEGPTQIKRLPVPYHHLAIHASCGDEQHPARRRGIEPHCFHRVHVSTQVGNDLPGLNLYDPRDRILGPGHHDRCVGMRTDGDDGTLVHLPHVVVRGSHAGVPDDDAAVLGPGADELAAEPPAAAGDALAVAGEHLHQLPRGRPPHPGHVVRGARQDGVPLRVPEHPLDLLRRPLEGVDQGAGGRVPDPRGPVVGARRHVPPVVAEGDLGDGVGVPLEAVGLHAREGAVLLLDPPQHGDVVLPARRQQVPVCGADGD
mmetsp:Transcript_75781/g.214239  ORF Transcript_75781/g.214239 Transcript_75781/m.214239 type:complete len:259 (-) Transcript_75781:355-1131(-)